MIHSCAKLSYGHAQILIDGLFPSIFRDIKFSKNFLFFKKNK